MDQMLKQSVLLLILTASAVSKRKMYEKMCGYPDDYGDDNILLKRIIEFLKSDQIKPLVEIITQEEGL